jgi:hypothetical protein
MPNSKNPRPRKLVYENINDKKRASTFFSLASGELAAANELVNSKLYKAAVIHLYLCSTYLAQSSVADKITLSNTQSVDELFNAKYGSGVGVIPISYINLFNQLNLLYNQFSSGSIHTPQSDVIITCLKQLQFFYKRIERSLEKVTTIDVIKNLREENVDIVKDISYDIYCPKTYSHHNRLTFWQPPFYLDIFNQDKIALHAKELLKKLRIKNSNNYVVGINSKVNQYEDNHYLMLDFDSIDTDVEESLHKIGGVLLKSGRGLHFIGKKVIIGKAKWEDALKSISQLDVLKDKIDKDHVKISLNRGYSTLRITDSPVKPSIPIFYKEF